MIARPGQRRGVSAASAVNAKVAFWFAACQGGLNGALFVDPLKRLMYRRKKPLHLVIDGLPAHKNKVVKDYVASTDGAADAAFPAGLCVRSTSAGSISA